MAADSAELSPEDLELIGEATSWTGPTEHCIEVRERAFSAYAASGDRRSAARLALALVCDHSFATATSVAAQKSGDRDLAALALHAEGSMLVRDGEVEEGWALIDEEQRPDGSALPTLASSL